MSAIDIQISVGAFVEWCWQEKTEVIGGGGWDLSHCYIVYLCPHGLTWNRTPVSAVWGWRLPTWSI